MTTTTTAPPSQPRRTDRAPKALRPPPASPTLARWLLSALASLRLTVVLLALAMVLILAGTLAQQEQGIWQVQKRYFHTFLTWIDLALFLPRTPSGQAMLPGGFPMPGGYTLIALLMANLVTAYATRLRFSWLDLLILPELGIVYALSWPFYSHSYYQMMAVMVLACAPLLAHALILHRKRGGVIMIHSGVALLILGEVVTSLWAKESQMTLSEGQRTSFSQDIRHAELAITDASDPATDRVVVIAASRLARGGTIEDPRLPFAIRVDRYHPNADLAGPEQIRRGQAPPRVEALADRGIGAGVGMASRPPEPGTDGGVDAPGAFVTLLKSGESLGTYLVALNIQQPQNLEVDGKPYHIELRFERIYRPYSVELIDFAHDRFTGTNIPRNFSSHVRVDDPRHGEQREVRIWMNHPFRHDGETYYQSGFRGEQTTILQIVRNPGVLLPYVSCTVVSVGMLLHFGMHLSGFLGRRARQAAQMLAAARSAPRRSWAGWAVPVGLAALCLALVVGRTRQRAPESTFDFASLRALPASFEGRVMPLDSVARNALRVLSGRGEYKPADGPRMPAIQWMADVMAKPESAEAYRVFRIEGPDIQSLLGLDPNQAGMRYSYAQILPSRSKLFEQAAAADAVERTARSRYQVQILEFWSHVSLYEQLAAVGGLFLAPPVRPGEGWRTLAQAHADAESGGQVNPGVAATIAMLEGYRAGNAESFNAAARGYRADLLANMPATQRRAEFEVMFNATQPFLASAALYVAVFLLATFSWLGWSTPLRRSALLVLVVALAIHTVALVARIYIQGRPPVTNLYSSAIFIGWVIGVLALVAELIFRNTFGLVVAAVAGVLSLVIAHNLAGDGDTMRMLQAVLDTNFWLATHVLAITIGYSATFLAGLLAIVYIIGGVTVRGFSESLRADLARMVYGVVCFAMLFSFVGTILGGIWADQSWGRFWGWDPKENGAALLVLWNAIILHARWGGLVRHRGLMLLAVFGNIVTSWSWFGTNMLGVGLHSYGFMDSAQFWLGAFIASQMFIIGIGSLPLDDWRSIRAQRTAASPA